MLLGIARCMLLQASTLFVIMGASQQNLLVLCHYHNTVTLQVKSAKAVIYSLIQHQFPFRHNLSKNKVRVSSYQNGLRFGFLR